MVIPLVGTSVHSYVHACTCPLTFPSLCVPPVVPSAPQEATTCTASDPSPHPQPPTPAPGMGMGCVGTCVLCGCPPPLLSHHTMLMYI